MGRDLFAPAQAQSGPPKPGRDLLRAPTMSESLKAGIGLIPEAEEDKEKYGYRPDLPWERQSRRFRDHYETLADEHLQGRRMAYGVFAENDTKENLERTAQRFAAENEYKLPGRGDTGPKTKPLTAFLSGAADVGRYAPGGMELVQALGEGMVGDKSLDYNADIDASMTQSLKDRPLTTRGGQIATLMAPGAGIYKGATMAPVLAGKLMSPAVAARLANQTLINQGIKYAGRGAVLAGASSADYYLYNAAAESANVAREEGRPMPSLGERIQYANEQVFTPGGAIAALAGPATSVAGRLVRAPLAAGKNLVTTGTVRRAIPQQGAKPQIVGTHADLFTPTDVQGRVMAGGLKPTTPSQRGRTAEEEAYDLLLEKGLDPEKVEKLVKLVSYNRYTEVDEMLFELASMVDNAADIDQLAVALARVGGDAQRIFRQGFHDRTAEMPDRIRVALRDALGLSGDNLEDFGRQMAAKAKEATADGYAAAYGRQVSDESWAKIYQRLLDTTEGFSPNLTNDIPDGIAAARAGAREARATANGDKAQLEAARQLDELAGALAGRSQRAPKLSTHALDFLDRGFGSRIADASRGTQRSVIGLRNAIRQSGLDADTGLDVPRKIYAQHMAVQDALVWASEKAAKKAISLRDLKSQFLAAKKLADDAFDEGIGEGKSVIDQALVMGWLRGSEDLIETATNSPALIRQIYGSERQRAKLLEMMPDTSKGVTKKGGQHIDVEDAGTGDLGDQTKRIRALVGGKRTDGQGAVESLFDRQRRMLENQTRVSGNSQTSNAQEAIAAQGGMARLLDGVATAVMSPQQAARNVALWALKNTPLFKPAIFKPAVNRKLGRILTTRGREELLEVIAKLRARQIATGKGPKPTGTPPAGGQGGHVHAAGFAGFGKKKPLMTREEMAASDIELTNAYKGMPRAADTPRETEIARLAETEAAMLSKLDDLNNEVIDMGVDPAILQDRAIRASDVSANAWPRVQELMKQMDDAAGRLMRARDQMQSLRNTPEADAFGRRPAPAARPSASEPDDIKGAGFMGFGKKTSPDMPENRKAAIDEVQQIIAERAAVAESVPVTRGATKAEWDEAVASAESIIRHRYGTRFAALYRDLSPASSGPDSVRMLLREELASVHLREMGLDPAKARELAGKGRGTNAQWADRKQARKDRTNAERDPTPEEQAAYELEDTVPGLSLSAFAESAAKDLRLNMPASEMAVSDIVDIAERYARAYVAKGGKNVTDLERTGHLIYTTVRGNIRSGGLGDLKHEAGQQAILAGVGSIGGSANDLNGDGKKDWKDAAIGAGGALLGGNSLRGAGALKNAFAEGGRTVGKPRAAKPVPKRNHATELRDRAVDTGATVAGFSIAPTAQAQTPGYSAELQAANDRVTELETKTIAGLESDLRTLEDPSIGPREKQRILQSRGYDLGPKGMDGVIGVRTTAAIAQNRADIRKELTVARDELKRARAEAKQLEIRAAQAAAQSNTNGGLGKLAPWAGAASGLLLAYGSRRGGVRKSAVAARIAAQRANDLLNAKPVSRAATGPDSLNTRAANVNEFWRLGGAGENVPFRANQKGQWSARPKATEPSQLYPKGATRFHSSDVGIIGGSLGEAGLAHTAANAARQDIAEAKADVEKFAAAGDVAGMERAMARQKQAENMLAAAVFFERAGLALAAGRTAAAFKMPYATARPNIAAAEKERALLLATMAKGKK